jgi:tryptophanyl-tRNA synthetase
MKKECIELLQAYVQGYQDRRKVVTDEVLDSYMKPRKLIWSRSHTLDALATKDVKSKKKKGKDKKENKGAKEETKAEAAKDGQKVEESKDVKKADETKS